MARLIGPDESVRAVYLTAGSDRGKYAAQGMSVPLYADDDLTVPADVQYIGGGAIPGAPPTLTVDAYSRIPLFEYPDGVDVVYTSINGGPPVPLYASTDERIDAVAATAVAAETPAGAQSKASAAQAAATSAAATDATTKANAAIATSKTYVDRLPGRIPFGAVRIDPDQVSAVHAAEPLITPTSDGSGQAVHPGMYYNPAGWGSDSNGKSYRYWMAMTPYPDGLEAVENPEILASDDGITWVVPPGLTNPIDIPSNSPVGFYPDPDLIEVDGTLWCIYALDLFKSSTDGITWSARQEATGITGSVSPTIQRVDGEFWVWTVLKTSDGSPYTLKLHKASTITGPYTFVANCTFPVPVRKDLWHICIRKVGDQYCAVAALCDKGSSGTNTELHFGSSDDGVVWDVSTRPILAPAVSTWVSKQIYQSSIVPFDGRDGRLFGLWYTGVELPNTWHIGYTEIVSERLREGLAQTEAPNTLFAGQVMRGDARNRLANPSLLLAASGAIRPLGYTNNLPGFTGHAWDEDTEAFTASKTSGSGGGNIQLTHTDTFVEGEVWTASVEMKVSDPNSGSFNMSAQWLTAADATIGSAGTSTSSRFPDFRRISVTMTAPASAAKLRITYSCSLTAVPVQFWWRRAQLEKASVPTTYTPNMAVTKRAASGQVGNVEEWQTALGVGQGARVGLAVTKDARLKTGTDNEQTTVGAAGAAAALPATPTKYLRIELADGTQVVIPAYLQT